jgi:hypothetical protein
VKVSTPRRVHPVSAWSVTHNPCRTSSTVACYRVARAVATRPPHRGLGTPPPPGQRSTSMRACHVSCAEKGDWKSRRFTSFLYPEDMPNVIVCGRLNARLGNSWLTTRHAQAAEKPATPRRADKERRTAEGSAPEWGACYPGPGRTAGLTTSRTSQECCWSSTICDKRRGHLLQDGSEFSSRFARSRPAQSLRAPPRPAGQSAGR